MTDKVTDQELGGLHAALAMVIRHQVEAKADWVTEDGEHQEMFTASPALLAVAAKFLKDNDITCSVDDDSNLGRLDEILSGKQKQGRLSLASVSPIEAAGE